MICFFNQLCMAERVGFEPTLEFPLNTLSKRAPSATRPSLRRMVVSLNLPHGLMRGRRKWSFARGPARLKRFSQICCLHCATALVNIACVRSLRGHPCRSSRVAICSPPVWLSAASSVLARSGWARGAAALAGLCRSVRLRHCRPSPRANNCSSISAGSSRSVMERIQRRDLNFGFGQGDFAKTGDFEFREGQVRRLQVAHAEPAA